MSASPSSTRATWPWPPTPATPSTSPAPCSPAAQRVPLPLVPELGFQPDLEAIAPSVLAKARMIFVSYPNNPTGAVIEDDFFARLVAFAAEHDLVVVHDNAYADITYDGYVAPSFLETPGARDVGVEMFSLSKSYNMTGWRSGAMVGNRDVVDAYWRLKTNMDSGMFGAVQRASVAALSGPQDCVREMCRVYQRRRDLLVEALRTIGMHVEPPKGTIYLWAPVPDGYTSAELHRSRCSSRRTSWSRRGPPTAPAARATSALPDGTRRAAARGRAAYRGAGTHLGALR